MSNIGVSGIWVCGMRFSEDENLVDNLVPMHMSIWFNSSKAYQ